MSSYNYSFNNPVMYNDPSGADPDGWVKTVNNEIVFNSGILSQGDATEVYGQGSEYLDEAHELSYTGNKGHAIVLGEGGNYTSDGAKRKTKDDAEFHVKEATSGWFSGFASSLYARFKSGKEPMTIQSLKESLGETVMSLKNVSDIAIQDSYGHDQAMDQLKHDLSVFSKKPSYDQGFVVGGYSYVLAENAALAYATGVGMPKSPVKPIATFEESFPGWLSGKPNNVFQPPVSILETDFGTRFSFPKKGNNPGVDIFATPYPDGGHLELEVDIIPHDVLNKKLTFDQAHELYKNQIGIRNFQSTIMDWASAKGYSTIRFNGFRATGVRAGNFQSSKIYKLK